MHVRSLFFFISFLFCCVNANAQDKIFKIDGEVINAKILDVSVRTISYVRFDNQNGPEYVIPRRQVEKVTYENGREEFMVSPREQGVTSGVPGHNFQFRPNMLSISPIQFSENGLGVALSYERSLDENGIVAFYLPVAVTFNLSNGTYYNPNTNSTENANEDAMFYLMPGIKVYPTGSNGLVKYAIGPNFVIGTGQKSSFGYDPVSGQNTLNQIQTHTVLGVLINNSLNINPGKHVSLGFELGMGFTYLNRIGGLNQGTEFLVQGGFKVGYRF